MEVIIYNRLTLLDDSKTNPTEACRRWCSRRRLKVREVITEYSPRQRKLAKLFSSTRGKTIVVFSAYNFGTVAGLIQLFSKVQRSDMTLVFVRENLIFRAGSRNLKLIAAYCRLLEDVARSQRKEIRRKGTLVAKFMNRQIGRDRLPEELVEEAKAHLRAGLSARAVVRAMNGRIGRTSVQKIARELSESLKKQSSASKQ